MEDKEKKGGIFVFVHSIFHVLFHLEYQLATFSLPESQALQQAAALGSDADPGWRSASWSAMWAVVWAVAWEAVGAVVQAGRQRWGLWRRQSCRQASSDCRQGAEQAAL